MDAEYVSASSFRVLGDETTEFIAFRRVQLNCGVDGLYITSIVSATYNSTYTTVIVSESVITTNLSTVLYSVVKPGEFGNLPDHSHTAFEGQGGELNLQLNFTDLLDVPNTYSGTENQYLKSTGSGIVLDLIDSWVEADSSPTVYTEEYPFGTYYIGSNASTIFRKRRAVSYNFTSFLSEGVKSVVFDFMDNWGRAGCMFVRAIDFYDESDNLITITSSSDATATATTGSSSAFFAFNTSLSKTGPSDNVSWVGDSSTNQRLIVVFNTTKTIHRIDFTNDHYSGTNTDRGVKSTKIYSSTEAITDTVYGAVVLNSNLIFDGIIPIHTNLDIADTQVLSLINNVGEYDTGWDALLVAHKTFADLEDTPTTYSYGQYLRTTASGIEAIDGIVLKAPNNSEWMIQVTNSGTLYTVGL